MELIAIRHTEVSVPRGICYGISDVLPATDFKNDALRVKSSLSRYTADEVYCSPLRRCSMLARECGFSRFVSDDRLAEMNFGKWEMASWHTITDDYAESWFNDYLNVPCPGGESLRDMIVRVEKFLVDLQTKKHERVFCFTHAGPIRVLNHLLKELPLDNLFDIEINYGGIYSFRF
jgi:alpha-ribazole phosphatase